MATCPSSDDLNKLALLHKFALRGESLFGILGKRQKGWGRPPNPSPLPLIFASPLWLRGAERNGQSDGTRGVLQEQVPTDRFARRIPRLLLHRRSRWVGVTQRTQRKNFLKPEEESQINSMNVLSDYSLGCGSLTKSLSSSLAARVAIRQFELSKHRL